MSFDLNIINKNFIKRGFDSKVCNDIKEANNYILENFSFTDNIIIGMGNSLTLDAMGIKHIFSERGYAVYQHSPSSTKHETEKALLADLYLTSANAISSDGQIVNIDGTGNRVAATCYGPKEVIYVIGKNKITQTLDEAIKRARNIAAVQNAKRYNRKTPCVITGKCEDCLSPECICSIITVHRKRPYGLKTTIILVNEELGF